MWLRRSVPWDQLLLREDRVLKASCDAVFLLLVYSLRESRICCRLGIIIFVFRWWRGATRRSAAATAPPSALLQVLTSNTVSVHPHVYCPPESASGPSCQFILTISIFIRSNTRLQRTSQLQNRRLNFTFLDVLWNKSWRSVTGRFVCGRHE